MIGYLLMHCAVEVPLLFQLVGDVALLIKLFIMFLLVDVMLNAYGKQLGMYFSFRCVRIQLQSQLIFC